MTTNQLLEKLDRAAMDMRGRSVTEEQRDRIRSVIRTLAPLLLEPTDERAPSSPDSRFAEGVVTLIGQADVKYAQAVMTAEEKAKLLK